MNPYVLARLHETAPVSRVQEMVAESPTVYAIVPLLPVITPLAGDVIVTVGPCVSIVQVKDVGVASELPTASVANTENVCEPFASEE